MPSCCLNQQKLMPKTSHSKFFALYANSEAAQPDDQRWCNFSMLITKNLGQARNDSR